MQYNYIAIIWCSTQWMCSSCLFSPYWDLHRLFKNCEEAKYFLRGTFSSLSLIPIFSPITQLHLLLIHENGSHADSLWTWHCAIKRQTGPPSPHVPHTCIERDEKQEGKNRFFHPSTSTCSVPPWQQHLLNKFITTARRLLFVPLFSRFLPVNL